MLATSRDSESWRRPAAITSSWEWSSTMAEGRSPSVNVLWQRQCLAYGRDSIFVIFGHRRGCCLRDPEDYLRRVLIRIADCVSSISSVAAALGIEGRKPRPLSFPGPSASKKSCDELL